MRRARRGKKSFRVSAPTTNAVQGREDIHASSGSVIIEDGGDAAVSLRRPHLQGLVLLSTLKSDY
jgi:hypothetical protein